MVRDSNTQRDCQRTSNLASIFVKRFSHRSFVKSCSHTLNTWYPSAHNLRRTRLSRERFAAILPAQNSDRDLGTFRRHLGHPCQKQPCTNTARWQSGKKKSGRVMLTFGCLTHPPIFSRINASSTRSSVERLPKLLMRDIRSERWDGESGSVMIPVRN